MNEKEIHATLKLILKKLTEHDKRFDAVDKRFDAVKAEIKDVKNEFNERLDNIVKLNKLKTSPNDV